MEGLTPSSGPGPMLEKKTKPKEQLNCPRCNSANTKFCYYNNYSLTQPRYFCKTCRRYWTEGGSLRNVPVGGGSRKNKKAITSSSYTTSVLSSSPLKITDPNPPSLTHIASQNTKSQSGQDLNLAFPSMENCHGMSRYVHEVPKLENSNSIHHHVNSCSTSSSVSALELLRSGMVSRGLSPYIPTLMPGSDHTLYPSSGFLPQELKPALDFSVDHGIGNRYAVQENNGSRHVFPFAKMKNLSASNDVQQHKEQPSSIGYWNGLMGEGSW